MKGNFLRKRNMHDQENLELKRYHDYVDHLSFACGNRPALIYFKGEFVLQHKL